VVSAVSSTYIPTVFRNAIDIFVNNVSPPINERLNGIMSLVLLTIVLEFLNLAAAMVEGRYMGILSQAIIRDIRKDMFGKIQVLSLRYFGEGRTGDLVSKLTNDVEYLSDFFSTLIDMVVSDTIPVFVALYFMVSWNPQLTLITVATLPLFLLPSIIFRSRARRIFRRTRRTISEITSQIEENVSGVRVIQSLAREKRTQRIFNEANARNFRANLEASTAYASFGSGVQALMGISHVIVIFFSAQLFFGGSLSLGEFFAFQLYLQQLFQPIMDISGFYNSYQSSMAASERIFSLLNEPVEPAEAESDSKGELGSVQGEIEYSHVTFGYNPATPILSGVSLKIPANTTMAVVGPTGAGKTSLINLLARFYRPQEGKIMIDGNDISAVPKSSLRRLMGIVLQETFLFQGTIRENIRYGRLEANDEEIVAAAKHVEADDFIMRLPQGYDTIIREGASNISVGQRQMISFARALLANPRILILDEATSSVDPYTEFHIQEGLRALLKDRTALVIAHRLSTVRDADQIIVLNNGVIEERGNHQELFHKGGLYSTLYRTQFRDVEET